MSKPSPIKVTIKNAANKSLKSATPNAQPSNSSPKDNSATNDKSLTDNDKNDELNDIDESHASVLLTDDTPKSKAALIDLYHTTPLKIVNGVGSKTLAEVNEQRIALYNQQIRRTQLFYSAPPHIRPTYLVHELKSHFLEYEQYHLLQALDKQAVIDLDRIELMWQQLHIVDDLITDVIRRMPAQKPVGWQLVSGSKNHLKLPTVGRLRDTDSIADQGSLVSYVLGQFGVMSYTFDRAFYIGHVVGYLFCCYYFAHLSIAYSVTPLPPKSVLNYEFASLETAKVVRLLQSLDEHCKQRIYQLAVYCARISSYKLDKYIEKLLITEVNDFNKKQQIASLDTLLMHGIMPDSHKNNTEMSNIAKPGFDDNLDDH